MKIWKKGPGNVLFSAKTDGEQGRSNGTPLPSSKPVAEWSLCPVLLISPDSKMENRSILLWTVAKIVYPELEEYSL